MGLLDSPSRGRASSSAAQAKQAQSHTGASPPMTQGESSRPGSVHHFHHQPRVLPRLLTRLKDLTHGHIYSPPSSPRSHKPNHSISSALHRSESSARRSQLCQSPSQYSLPLSQREPDPEVELDRQRPALKMRLVTMNMHDELPLGDLTDFLGEVRDFRRRRSSSGKRPSTSSARHSLSSSKSVQRGPASSAPSSATGSIVEVPCADDLPKLPLAAGHPYHLIVVASQECPLASGVLSGKVRTLDGRGWTTLLEEWLCGGTEEQIRKGEQEEPIVVEDEGEKEEEMVDWAEETRKSQERAQSRAESASVHSRAPTLDDLEPDVEDRFKGRGPYVLVEKERLMGIYLAVFVARECDQLLTGTSKARVTAGLIGGRLGNKGGVGISINFAGQRMLFVSAHLAAHASALEIRKANVIKILNELEVDDFLPEPPKDEHPHGDHSNSNANATGNRQPNSHSHGHHHGYGHHHKPLHERPLTDRFDQTFFMGDLNFRLDISRLHADWLTKSKKYATALEFDQLRKVLAEPQGVFDGFNEAPISFAPTFKYDLPKRVKQKRSGLLRSPTKQGAGKRGSKDWKALKLDQAQASDPASPLQSPPASEPTTPSIMDVLPESSKELGASTGPGKVKDDDALSLASSAATEMSDFENLELVDDQGKIIANTAPAEGADPTSPIERKKAQVKFMTLVKQNSAAFLRKRSATATAQEDGNKPPAALSVPGAIASRKHAFSVSGGPPPMLASASRPPLRPSQSELVVSQSSEADSLASPPAVGEVEQPEPVFDSSSKQRVQSYTDRILFKSTIPVAKPLPPTPVLSTAGSHSRRGSVFVDAIRALAPHKQSTVAEPAGPAGPGLNRSWTTGDTSLPVEEHSVSNRLGRLFARERAQPTRSVSGSSQRPKSADPDSSFEHPQRTNSHPTVTGLMPFTLSPEHSPAADGVPSGVESAATSDSRLSRGGGRHETTLKAPRRAQSASPTREPTRWTSLQIGGPGPKTQSPTATAPASPSDRSHASLTPRGTAPPSRASPTAAPADHVGFAFPPIANHAAKSDGATSAQSTTPSDFSNPWSTSGKPSPATSPVSTRSSSANHIAFSDAAVDPTSQGRPGMYARHSISSGGSGANTHRDDPTAAGGHGARDFLRHAASGLPRSLTISRRDGDGNSGAKDGLTRLKSFFHLPALPGMKPISLFGDRDPDGEAEPRRREQWTGPRRGEWLVLRYDAVTDLVRMGAYSDHRPVFLEVVMGLGSSEEDGEEA